MVKLTNIKNVFRLYKSDSSTFESTFYDLISGDNETKQTKGLAYLFSVYPGLISRLLQNKSISTLLKNKVNVNFKSLESSDLVTIDAEMLSNGKPIIRRDITITFYKDNKKLLLLVIEAKSIKQNDVGDITSQLLSYFDPTSFPSDVNVPKIGITLSKYRHIFDNDKHYFVSLTWMEVIEILNDVLALIKEESILQKRLIREYLKFLLEVDGGMKFYEKEVLSVPAAGTIQQITQYDIHSCPNSYSYKTPLYIAFREKGGYMDTLYQIEDIVVINPNNPSYEVIIDKSNLAGKERVKRYIEDRRANFGFERDIEYRFYVLSKKKNIRLVHRPRISGLSGHCYFSLSELLNGHVDVVVESKE
ncbi:hypothetical protein [Paenibacillus sp. Soil522]|uniref:hypothetical protein n=1 Tax=Paenibacillus sp. Soil522 TaxID=1736388 RepID=UPI0006F2CC50|nr:hypothetical protein [Paenibacillus sp. Soil522]KRE45822.1 hypothetical protein ASG81_12395 [Paenibacillus sp. Soil522]